MSDEKKERSFLATLDLKDGTKLGFSKITVGGSDTEEVEELCANSLLTQSIKIRFEPNDEGYYVMFFKGFAAADKIPHKTKYSMGLVRKILDSQVDSGLEVDVKSNSSSGVALNTGVTSGEYSEDGALLQVNQITASQSPEPEPPIYLAVSDGGWVHKTKESGYAYLAGIADGGSSKFSIDRTDAQDVYLKSWRSKNFMQTYKRQDFPGGSWFAWMTDCDGTDALLKLTIIERYNADGSVKK
ncbi:hypothetical protein [Pseudomonas syringae]|uniref:hypothetical protein n=3 Tax=Pseudomonas syringae TaxID=317 RepID=UPI00076089B5|nr:hypothetical protein [Pseudomonas syringae]KWS27982.1 hypothetical protein AL061_10565 [Pseudomonas syringae pv. syringae]MCH5513116.1 hypothetical protein [Pseudomonas syringae pv. syringae]POR72235.1 hypothetical protein BKM27_04470 [Pseudomonas syringae pv. syringae]POR81252.1 hypothetical protein BKM30_04435 [Pseudomonas syringae pv. syringae]QGG75054.1 hypothetical protein N028_06605 [Pseudomonas syringae USA011]